MALTAMWHVAQYIHMPMSACLQVLNYTICQLYHAPNRKITISYIAHIEPKQHSYELIG